MKNVKRSLVVILIILSSLLIADPPNWEVIPGTQYSLVMISQASLFGDPVVGGSGNIIASFGPGGENDCRSIALWQPVNPPELSFWYSTIVGNLTGELIIFKLYDAASDQIYTFNETIIFQDGQTFGSPGDPFLLTVQDGYIGGEITLLTTTPPAGNITEVELECNGEITNPSANGLYQFSLSNGVYDIMASLPGYTTVTLTDVILQGNQGVNDADITLIDWEQISGTQYNMVIMTTADIFGVPILGGEGNLVAAFGPGGDVDCRGIAEWQEANPPYWEGYWYFTIVADENGETINFKIFDNESESIYECYETIEFMDDTTLGSPEEPYNLSNGSSQTFDLSENWNWISLYVHPGSTLIESVFAPLVNDLNQIQSQYESAVYYAPSGNWVGDLINLTDGEAYLVQMNNAVNSFQIVGTPIQSSTPISLDSNWNWVAYYPQKSLGLSEALISIQENVYQVKNQNQSSTYINPPGSWQGDLDIMEPNQGYKICMNSPDELVYMLPANDQPAQNIEIPMLDPPEWQVIPGTQYSMILMAEVSLNGDVFDGTGENTIAAFGPGGETDCRSIALWEEPNPPHYIGFWYFTIVGNDNGDEINFQLYDEVSDQIVACEETMVFANGEIIGSPSDLFSLTANGSGIEKIDLLPSSHLNLSVYPNPFNPSTTITFELDPEAAGNVELTIYNLKGQKVRALDILSDSFSEYNSNRYTVNWNGKDDSNQPVSSGIYFIRLKVGNKEENEKVLFLK